jgi:hypothetical protein
MLLRKDENLTKANRFQESNCVTLKEETDKPTFEARPSLVVVGGELVVGGGV